METAWHPSNSSSSAEAAAAAAAAGANNPDEEWVHQKTNLNEKEEEREHGRGGDTRSKCKGSATDQEVPVRELREVVRLCMLLEHAATEFPYHERERMFREVHLLTQRTAQRMLCDPWHRQCHEGAGEIRYDVSSYEEAEIPSPALAVAPPRAFFAFRGGGFMALPSMDWSAFRGYSMAFWLNVDPILPPSSASEHGSARFELFRFTNSAGTLGVEASLVFDQMDPTGRPLLMVQSCSPSVADSRHGRSSSGVAASIAPSSGQAPPEGWTAAGRIALQYGQWHLLVISHSLPYVKKSKVTCFLDTTLQFSEELVYPSGLVQASKCTVGGGLRTSVRVASVSMYEDEVSRSVVATLYTQGPRVDSFRRWSTVITGSTAQHLVDLRDTTVLSPLTLSASDRLTALSKMHTMFSFSATDAAMDVKYSELAIDWIAEGNLSAKGKWVSLEPLQSSSEIQQRNAKLVRNVIKQAMPDIKLVWQTVLGVEAIPILLHYMLNTYETLLQERDAMGTKTTGEVLADDNDGDLCSLESVIADVVVNFHLILKGMLLNDFFGMHQALRGYVIHLMSHVARLHATHASTGVIWGPASIVACVDVVKSMYNMLPLRAYHDGRSVNHPTQPSIWTWNPIFASGVRAWIFDYRVWSKANFKSRSILNHQLYALACEHPKALNDLSVVSRVLEILQLYYVSETDSDASSTSDSQETKAVDKEYQWRQQSINTLVDVIEVCLTNQSVHVNEVLEQELIEATFTSDASNSTHPGGVPATPAVGSHSGAPGQGGRAVASVAHRSVRHGGALYIDLENIIWSDQEEMAKPTNHGANDNHHTTNDDTHASAKTPTSALPCVQVRFSLLRDLREVIRFLTGCGDVMVSQALLLLLRRLAVSYLDMRFALVSSDVLDCILFLMRPSSTKSGNRSPQLTKSVHNAAVDLRARCVPLLVYMLDWLESVEGRTVWCGLEEHLRSIINGEGNYTRGFLELMTEFYFDPTWLTGAQQSIIMNDPSKSESVLFPISPITDRAVSNSSPTIPSTHSSGIVVDDGLRDSAGGGGRGNSGPSDVGHDLQGSSSRLSRWIKMATTFSGKRLSLSWEKRVLVIRMAALRSLTLATINMKMPLSDTAIQSTQSSSVSSRAPPQSIDNTCSAEDDSKLTETFEENINILLGLPLKGILPFLPVLLAKTSAHFREKVIMDINVSLKMDDSVQEQILMMKKEWVEAMLELSLACAVPPTPNHLSSISMGSSQDSRESLSTTGEDLVMDSVVSLLCAVMHHARGWRSFVDVIAALKIIQYKYSIAHSVSSSPEYLNSPTPVSVTPPAVNVRDVAHCTILVTPLDWLAQVTGVVMQRMSRSRTVLSKVLAENVHKVLYLVQEVLLATPFRRDQTLTPGAGSRGGTWSDAQVFLLNAVVDICTRLVDSTHKLYRGGLAPGLQILLHVLTYTRDAELTERITLTLECAFQQELNVASPLRVYDTRNPRDVFLSALVYLRRALVKIRPSLDSTVEIEGTTPLHFLTLKVCTSDVFLEDLHTAGLSVHLLSEMTEAEATSAVLEALALLVNEAEMHEQEELADMIPLFASAKDLCSPLSGFGGVSSSESEEGSNSTGLTSSTRARALSTEQAVGGSLAAPLPSSLTPSTESLRLILLDDNERSLWAALEVEENRMIETCNEMAVRKQKQFTTTQEQRLPYNDAWTRQLWVTHAYRFLSQHQHRVLAPYPRVLEVLSKCVEYGMGIYETPAPARIRRTLDVIGQQSIAVNNVCTENGTSDVIESFTAQGPSNRESLTERNDTRGVTVADGATVKRSGSVSGEHTEFDGGPEAELDSMRREYRRSRFSLQLTTPGSEGQRDTFASSNQDLLERVGRVVAAQGGGEIRDITADPLIPPAASDNDPGADRDNNGSDTGGSPNKDDIEPQMERNEGEGEDEECNCEERQPSGRAISTVDTDLRDSDLPPGARTTSELIPHSVKSDTEHEGVEPAAEDGPIPSVSATTASAKAPPTATRASSRLAQLWHVDAERHVDSGLDPGEGVALPVGESILAQAKCRRVIPEGLVTGSLYFSSRYLVFVPVQSWLSDGAVQSGSGNGLNDTAPGLRRCWRWKYKHVVGVFLRRYRLRDSAIEVFFRNGTNHFLDFPHVVKQQRNELVRLLYSFLPRQVPKQWPGRSISGNGGGGGSGHNWSVGMPTLAAATRAWQTRQMSNFDYLMALNTLAGRSFNDLTQYPIFPWVLSNYESASLDLKDPRNYRDLSKPVGALNPARLAEFWERYESFDDPVIPKFLYGSHYSTCAGVVLFFLFRLQPFASLHRKMQGHGFDLPDRLFHSIRETWDMCNSHMSEVKELTPEFFCDASFLTNVNDFALGTRHDHVRVGDVELPPWAEGSPQKFVGLHRAALESEYVSQNLHSWIDLIFGAKQRGKAALRANNVFYYLTYYGVVDLDRVEDPYMRESMELQIAHFGQCPMQLFSSAHPRRSSPNPGSSGVFRRRFRGGGGNGGSNYPGMTNVPTNVSGGNTSSTDTPSVSTSPSVPTIDSMSTTPVSVSTTSSPIKPHLEVEISPRNHSPIASVPNSPGPSMNPTQTVASPHAPPSMTRSLVAMFADPSTEAQELRRQWSSPTPIKPLARSAIRWIRIFPDRFITVNELGVIELYHWKLVAKPQAPTETPGAPITSLTVGSATPTGSSVPALVASRDFEASIVTGEQEHGTRTDQSIDQFDQAPSEVQSSLSSPTSSLTIPPSPLVSTSPPVPVTCPWLVEIGRDTSPFDVVPRVPVFEGGFPLVTSLSGRVVVSGGASNGSLQLRLLDLDNAHVVAKASVTGHAAPVTCLSVDRWAYHAPGPLGVEDGEDEVLLSGARDGTLALWRLSRLAPSELLYRAPRISACALLTLRGHGCGIDDNCDNSDTAVVDCCINTYLNVAASCSVRYTLVHFLHDNGAVAFSFSSTQVVADAQLEADDESISFNAPASTSSVSSTVSADAMDITTARARFTHIKVSSQGVVIALVRSEGDVVEGVEETGKIDERTGESNASRVNTTCVVYNLTGVRLLSRTFYGDSVTDMRLSSEGDIVIFTVQPNTLRLCRLDDLCIVQEYHTPSPLTSAISAVACGPTEAMMLAVTGHDDGTLVIHLLPDADGSVSLLNSIRRFLGVNAKLKMVKGTVQQAQNLAWTTFGNAKVVTSTARDIAGEALGEAKSMMKGFFSYLRQSHSS